MNDEEFKELYNFREIDLERCVDCNQFYYSDTGAVCGLDGGPVWNKEDKEEFRHICDEFELKN